MSPTSTYAGTQIMRSRESDEIPVRVAHIIGSVNVGGAERHFVNMLNVIACDSRVAIFLDRPSSGASFLTDLDPHVERHFVRIRMRNFPLGTLRLASVLKRTSCNVVHTHMFAASLYGAMAARLAGVPVVVTTEHGENPWKRAGHRWLERRVISPLVDARFCVSSKIMQIRRDIDRVPAAKLRLTTNGTPVPARSQRPSTNLVPLVGSVGRFVPPKDFPRLLHAVSELRRRGYRLQLCLVGDGPEMANVKRAIKELGLEDIVELPGMVTDVGDWYQRFDVYVSSSEREGQPVTLLEAMAHGIPVVATDVGATAETVQSGVGGLIVPPRDTTALADALSAVLDSTELRRTLGENARARVEQYYSIGAVAEYYLSAYREILSGKQL